MASLSAQGGEVAARFQEDGRPWTSTLLCTVAGSGLQPPTTAGLRRRFVAQSLRSAVEQANSWQQAVKKKKRL